MAAVLLAAGLSRRMGAVNKLLVDIEGTPMVRRAAETLLANGLALYAVTGHERERVEEALKGDNAMNCLLCKYREQIIGYEADVGAPQAGHHHHVRGIGTDGHNAHDHGVHGHHHGSAHDGE